MAKISEQSAFDRTWALLEKIEKFIWNQKTLESYLNDVVNNSFRGIKNEQDISGLFIGQNQNTSAIRSLEQNGSFKGKFDSPNNLSSIVNPIKGDWAEVGTQEPYSIYVYNGTSWDQTGTKPTITPKGLIQPFTEYIDFTTLSELKSKYYVGDFAIIRLGSDGKTMIYGMIINLQDTFGISGTCIYSDNSFGKGIITLTENNNIITPTSTIRQVREQDLYIGEPKWFPIGITPNPNIWEKATDIEAGDTIIEGDTTGISNGNIPIHSHTSPYHSSLHARAIGNENNGTSDNVGLSVDNDGGDISVINAVNTEAGSTGSGSYLGLWFSGTKEQTSNTGTGNKNKASGIKFQLYYSKVNTYKMIEIS